jgi:DNA-binding CsgD family transcriptional regulator
LKEEFKKDSKQEVNCEFNMESLKESKKEQNKVPIWNITHYTGRGVQLWWCFEQVASALRGPYRHTQQGIGEKIDAVLKSHKEFSQLSIDPTTYKETGYFRMFETYNSHAEAYTEVEIEHEKRYKLQDLIDALQGDLVIPHSKKQSDVKSWTFMSVMNARRMKLIEDVLKDRTDINSGKKFQYSENFSNQMNWGLLIYYNCARYSLSQEKSKSKTEKLIKYFDCVEDEELDAIYKFVDGFYDSKKILKFRNETIIQYLDLDEDEQNKYDFHAFTGEWDWAKCKPNRTRDEQRKQRKEEKYARICSLYALGYTQAQVAAEMGCNINTVNSILKKCGINRKTERILLISQLKAEHLRQKEVAEQLNISVRTVQRYWEAA